MPRLESVAVAIAAAEVGDQKLGHPVPESNLASDAKSRLPQQTQR
jgi:hypothetical protein